MRCKLRDLSERLVLDCKLSHVREVILKALGEMKDLYKT
jgi:predicted DNA-binding protein